MSMTIRAHCSGSRGRRAIWACSSVDTEEAKSMSMAITEILGFNFSVSCRYSINQRFLKMSHVKGHVRSVGQSAKTQLRRSDPAKPSTAVLGSERKQSHAPEGRKMHVITLIATLLVNNCQQSFAAEEPSQILGKQFVVPLPEFCRHARSVRRE